MRSGFGFFTSMTATVLTAACGNSEQSPETNGYSFAACVEPGLDPTPSGRCVRST